MLLLGAIAGDVLGSTYEFHNYEGLAKNLKFFPKGSFATDDSILTCAVADALLAARQPDGAIDEAAFSEALPGRLRRFAAAHPEGGYGGRFLRWLKTPDAPAYGSLGNGSAMRVSACAWAVKDEAAALRLAELSALPTHNHRLGVLGARATVWAIRRFQEGAAGRERVRREWKAQFGALGDLPDVDRLASPIDFDETCPGTVPLAVSIALATDDWEDAVRLAVSLGGDCDTTAAIAGSIARGGSPVPLPIEEAAMKLLTPDLRRVVTAFESAFGRA